MGPPNEGKEYTWYSFAGKKPANWVNICFVSTLGSSFGASARVI